MKKIKEKIIHLFGGVTIEESKESDTNSFHMGWLSALSDAKAYAKSINGTPADDWCKLMYKHIADGIKEEAETLIS